MLLYIHIPFCDSKCFYCSFNSYVDKFHLKKSYMDALYLQLFYELKRFDVKEKEIETVFIGGGTPSTVSAALYKKIFELINPYIADDAEITTEANPNSATRTWIEEMKELGINRISFGVQSFDDKKLKFLNRAHNRDDALRAVKDAADAGIQNISIDLIYATVLDTKELLQEDFRQAFELPINHLSAYALTIEEGTPFEKKPDAALEKLSLTNFVFETIKEKGFTQYEISNFGRYQSRHNLGYWQYKDYIGAGSGAVGCKNGVRYYPSSDLEAYIRDPLHAREEKLTAQEQKEEKLFLGLRSIVGVDEKILSEKELKRAQLLADEKKLVKNGNTFYNLDYLLSDEISLFIIN
ncbi:radical SAM family heme chaperone HemW [Sulfurimonas sp. HSL-1716]|uniref:radical SAM family heme chaperone HemW n=1 Tax=Hydrocurvibacter sulfurireducens TaxID=3131937 RepID=UPI0031FA245F